MKKIMNRGGPRSIFYRIIFGNIIQQQNLTSAHHHNNVTNGTPSQQCHNRCTTTAMSQSISAAPDSLHCAWQGHHILRYYGEILGTRLPNIIKSSAEPEYLTN